MGNSRWKLKKNGQSTGVPTLTGTENKVELNNANQGVVSYFLIKKECKLCGTICAINERRAQRQSNKNA